VRFGDVRHAILSHSGVTRANACNAVEAGTTNALVGRMAMRSFRARDGATWTVWRVESTFGVAGTPEEWLAFQNEDGSARLRLLEIPASWDTFPDEGLEQLRIMAAPVKAWRLYSPPASLDAVGEASTDVKPGAERTS
jgi:hypothetical protein